MGASPDFMTGLLQMMQQGQGQQGQGITGGLMSDPNGLLGLSLLANSNTPGKFGSIFGRSALQANDIGLQNQNAQLDLMQKKLALGMMGQKLNALAGWNTPTTNEANQAEAQTTGAPNAPPVLPTQQTLGAPGQPMPGQPTVAPGAGAPPQRTGFDVPQRDVFSLPINGHTPDQYKNLQMYYFGKDAGEAEKSSRDLQLGTAQALVKPKLELLDQVTKSDQSAAMVRASQPLTQLWNQAAPKYGVDPNQMTDANVRRVMSARRNELASWAQLPTEAPPVQMVETTGPYGYRGQKNPVTGEEKQVQGREMPTFTTKPVWNPATNTNREVPIQTGGWGMTGTNPVSGRTSTVGAPGKGINAPTVAPNAGQQPSGPPGVDLGYKPPDDTNLKSAMFASEMRSGLEKVRQLESQGYTLKPSERALFINIAASHDSNVAMQLIGQEVLARKLSPESQQYMAALMPMLQAVGHDQSGARLSEYQIRQNLESVVPINAKDQAGLAQINKNRDGFYTGVLTQAGSAVQLPQYRNTLASDLQSAQGTRKTLNGKNYFQQNGKWYAE